MVSLFSSRSSPRCKLLLLTTSSPPDQGFTMFEVLVALMMSFLFLTGTLNAMVVSAIFQVKAERQARASYWIQDDLENARAQAAAYTDTAGCPSGVGAAFESDSTNGWASLTPTPKPTNTSLLDGYRIDRFPSPSGNILTLTYRVHKDINNSGTYDSATEEETIVAQLYTEVLPQAALNCP